MNTLLVRDDSEVAKSISDAISRIGDLTESTLEQVNRLDNKLINKLVNNPVRPQFDSIVVSSHQFAYDKDMDANALLNFYRTDLIQFSSLLENVDKYLPDGGKIIVILSMDYINGSFASKHYNALHAARRSLIQSYSNILATNGISINGIALGWIDDVLETTTDDNTKRIKAVARKFNPFSRLGKPEEVAELVVSLLRIKTCFLNGHVINFDGGQVNSDPVNKEEWELLVTNST
jgi:NAD(P)-dependent dehydrogenase (short-subunit alcohol dehydrogenase family)